MKKMMLGLMAVLFAGSVQAATCDLLDNGQAVASGSEFVFEDRYATLEVELRSGHMGYSALVTAHAQPGREFPNDERRHFTSHFLGKLPKTATIVLDQSGVPMRSFKLHCY